MTTKRKEFGEKTMAIIQKDIVVPDNLLPAIKNGEINIMGLAKNAENAQIVKHLDTLDLNKSDSSAKAAAVLIAAGVAAIAGISFGIYYFVKRSKVKRFKEALNAYVQAVNNKELTTEIIDNLLSALDKLKGKLRKKIQIEFSSDELTALIDCLCNHTQTLADANNINIAFETTEEEKEDILLRFRNNLKKQRDIFELAA